MPGALDWVAGAGIPIVSGIADAISGNANAKAARDAFKSRYQDTVRDMRKAGLNPALAYGQGGGNPQTHDRPLVGEQISKSAQMVGSAAQARANADLTEAQAKLLKAQTVDLIDQVRLRNAQIATDTTTSASQGALYEEQARQVRKTVSGLLLDNAYKRATLGERVDMLAGELRLQGIDITTRGIEQTLRRLDIPEAQAMADYWRSRFGKASPYVSTAKDIFQGFMPRMNINTGDSHRYFPRSK